MCIRDSLKTLHIPEPGSFADSLEEWDVLSQRVEPNSTLHPHLKSVRVKVTHKVVELEKGDEDKVKEIIEK